MSVCVIASLRRTALFCALLGAFSGAHAAEQCFHDAGTRYKLNPLLLWSIAKTESSFNPRAINRSNKNGSYDIGLMQINSAWLPTLKRYGIEERHLFDPCVSIHVGAWILAHEVARHGYTWKAVGAYNAKSTDKQVRYASKVLKTAYAALGHSSTTPAPRTSEMKSGAVRVH